MKKVLFLFLISISAFAQEHHFTSERQIVTWQNSYETTETDILKLIDKNHPKVDVDYQKSTGSGRSLNCKCDGTSFYLDSDFNMNFEVEIKEGKYRVTVNDIVFDSEAETESNNDRLEFFVLRMGQNAFHKTKQNLKNLICIDQYLTKLFTIPNSKESKWE